jgi:integrase
MSVRKREWTTRLGEQREAWVADYTDQQGIRHLKTFKRKKDADAFEDKASVEVKEGTHVADSASITVAEAGKLWIDKARQDELERTTVKQYNEHLRCHIIPYLGNTKLSQLSAPIVRTFEDKLRDGTPPPGAETAEPRSAAMTRKVLGSLGALLGEAQERGLVGRNVVRDLRKGRRRGKDRQGERRERGKLKVGIDIPAPAEIKAIIAALDSKSRWRPMIMTAIFTGLRASELRGLRWDDIDFKKGELHVRQRADAFQEIGRPKSEAGERTVPIPPGLLATLREWKLALPKKGDLGLCFPNSEGGIDWHQNICRRGFIPAVVAAGVVDKHGAPKYTGLHSLRHFYASWLINSERDGGQGLSVKVVQERLGHSSAAMTLDRYGHLFPRGDDTAAMGKAESALLS